VDGKNTHNSLAITASVSIPEEELIWSFSRSSGPGGQNVNKVNSKATLHWNVVATAVLPEDVRDRFLQTFRTRFTTRGEIVLSSQEYRDQPKNIEACREKLKEMLLSVWKAPKKRRPTKRTKGSQMRRLTEKKVRGDIKKGRRSSGEE
jgi:ribosome-associated protein